MERVCFVLHVKLGMEAEYDRRHRELWPELRALIERSGMRNYTIFRHNTLVIGYAECAPSFAATQAPEHDPDGVGARWHVYMSDVLDDADLQRIDEVWHLD